MPSQKQENVKYYFDLQEALQKLEKPQKGFLKTTISEGKSQIKQVKKIEWQKELAFFEQANLNKPALRGMYQEQKKQKQDTTFIYYTSKSDELKVKSLKVALLKDSSLVMAEAFIKTDNFLYSSEKYLTLICKKNSIERYHIRGKQKMIFTEPEYFEVEAKRIGE
ncbi:MAG: hypothetical protein OHK0045_14040 [Raineya sp.]